MAEGATKYGEEYRAVEMVDRHQAKTIPVQIVRRRPDGSEELGHTINETVAYGFTTLGEAVEKALDLYDHGVPVQIDHMPDGRGGHTGGYLPVCRPEAFELIVEYARSSHEGGGADATGSEGRDRRPQLRRPDSDAA